METTYPTSPRLLSASIDSFRNMRERGYVYVDKTELVYKLTHSSSDFIYLSRPRRFGKSLLVDTLYEYFRGSRDLFTGLAIDKLEADWKQYPILRLNMSEVKESVDVLRRRIDKLLTPHETTLQLTCQDRGDIVNRLIDIIEAYHDQGLPPLVVLIDEYDAPLQEHFGKPLYEEFATFYRNFFILLKAQQAKLRFVFLTGCARFKNLNLFSLFNNLYNISFRPDYATICGFTHDELTNNYQPEIARLADKLHTSTDETLDLLRQHYDGYLFSGKSPIPPKVYNPCSLVMALLNQEIENNWTSTGGINKHISNLSRKLVASMVEPGGLIVDATTLETSDAAMEEPIVTLYQAGYLTIDRCVEGGYALRIPNSEIREDLYKSLLPLMAGINSKPGEGNLFTRFGDLVRRDNIDEALWTLHLIIANAPGDNSELHDIMNESRIHFYFAATCYSQCFAVREEPRQQVGQPDLVVNVDDVLCLVVELKRSAAGGIRKAWRQMNQGEYVTPHLDGKFQAVYQLAIEVRNDGRDFIDYKLRKLVFSNGKWRQRKTVNTFRDRYQAAARPDSKQ